MKYLCELKSLYNNIVIDSVIVDEEELIENLYCMWSFRLDSELYETHTKLHET